MQQSSRIQGVPSDTTCMDSSSLLLADQVRGLQVLSLEAPSFYLAWEAFSMLFAAKVPSHRPAQVLKEVTCCERQPCTLLCVMMCVNSLGQPGLPELTRELCSSQTSCWRSPSAEASTSHLVDCHCWSQHFPGLSRQAGP